MPFEALSRQVDVEIMTRARIDLQSDVQSSRGLLFREKPTGKGRCPVVAVAYENEDGCNEIFENSVVAKAIDADDGGELAVPAGEALTIGRKRDPTCGGIEQCPATMGKPHSGDLVGLHIGAAGQDLRRRIDVPHPLLHRCRGSGEHRQLGTDPGGRPRQLKLSKTNVA
jgi:hypothetical protein